MRILLALAIIATVADAAAYFGLILTGHARELNPLWANASAWLALAAKALLVVALIAIIGAVGSGRLVQLVLLVAIVAGGIGAVSTIGAMA